jgi:hypothetical protein
MAGLDYLFNGTPQSLTNATTSTTDLPDWYQEYQRAMAGKATEVAGRGYTPYPGQQVAGFNNDQMNAFQQVRNNQGSWQPGLGSAMGSASGIAGAANAGTSAANAAAQGGYNSAIGYGNQAMGQASGAYGTAGGYAGQSAGAAGAAQGAAGSAASNANHAAQSGWNSAAGNYGHANSAAGIGAAIGTQGMANANQAAQGGYNAAASGFGGSNGAAYGAMGAAAQGTGVANAYGAGAVNAVSGPSQNWTGNFQQYMSPYTHSVVDEIGRQGNLNLTQNILPSIGSTFAGSGQFGSGRNAAIVGQGISQAQQGISGLQAQALENGYSQAGNLFNQDANRAQQQQQMQGQTALSAGQLANAGASLNANTALGAAGQLGTNSNNLGALGMQQANIYNQGANMAGALQMNAAGQYANTAQGMGNLGMQQANIYNQGGQLTANTDMNAAQQYGSLGNMMGNLGMQQAGLSQNVGQMAGSLGMQQGSLYNQGATINSGALDSQAQRMGALTQLQQSMQNQDTAALGAVGGQQQALQQAGDTAAYNDFQNQNNYDWTNLANMNSVLRGMPMNSQTTSAGNTAAQGAGVSPLGWLNSLYGSSQYGTP